MTARRAAIATILLLGAGCTADRGSVEQLAQLQQTKDPRQAAALPATCSETSEVCARVLEQHAAACLQLTEAADSATRAQMRRCAVDGFRAALAQTPSGSDPIVAVRGLAEALRVDRDNAGSAATRARDADELDGLAARLTQMPGGAAYGRYYAANNALYRVLTGSTPAPQACAALGDAQAALPQSAPDDLAARLSLLRNEYTSTLRSRSCG